MQNSAIMRVERTASNDAPIPQRHPEGANVMARQDSIIPNLSFGNDRVPARFWKHVFASPDGCWIWMGAGLEYGRFQEGGRGSRLALAHRYAYEHMVGPIPGSHPDGLTIDHLCRTPACVNPAHMELVDRGTNTLRGNTVTARNRDATHCKKGHPFDEANTKLRKGGGRACRTCLRNTTIQWFLDHPNYRKDYDAKRKNRD
jgi:hypothetical protein